MFNWLLKYVLLFNSQGFDKMHHIIQKPFHNGFVESAVTDIFQQHSFLKFCFLVRGKPPLIKGESGNRGSAEVELPWWGWLILLICGTRVGLLRGYGATGYVTTPVLRARLNVHRLRFRAENLLDSTPFIPFISIICI